MADTSTPAGRKREAALIAAGEAAEGADIPAEQLNRVRAAADVAQASEFVARMDGGYSAAIAQGGSNVSGGQKQRLSIARAVYRHPEVREIHRCTPFLSFIIQWFARTGHSD